jgi:TfoX/Sxy family transcriptional regulator of competence genes
MASLVSSLQLTVLDAAGGLPQVASRPMFGGLGVFRGSQIFALVHRRGRVLLRLPDAAAFAELAAIEDAEPWIYEKPSGKRVSMSHWIFAPEEWNDGTAALSEWIERAYGMALPGPAKKPAAKATKPAAKPKKPAAKPKKPAAKATKPTKPAAKATKKPAAKPKKPAAKPKKPKRPAPARKRR